MKWDGKGTRLVYCLQLREQLQHVLCTKAANVSTKALSKPYEEILTDFLCVIPWQLHIPLRVNGSVKGSVLACSTVGISPTGCMDLF